MIEVKEVQLETKEILRKGGEIVKTSNYIVKTIGFDFNTHEIYGIRYVNLDLINNIIFSECEDEWDIEDGLEMLWNRLNNIKSKWHHGRNEIVKVIEVYPLEEFIDKFPEIYSKVDTNLFYPVQSKMN